MRLIVLGIIIILGVLVWIDFLQDQEIWALRARLNAVEATVEPLAYFSVDFDNRLAKAEHSWRMEEANDDAR